MTNMWVALDWVGRIGVAILFVKAGTNHIPGDDGLRAIEAPQETDTAIRATLARASIRDWKLLLCQALR